MTYINFQELKTRVSILDALFMLELSFKHNKDTDQLRCKCPRCESDDDRAIVITPEKGIFYCHDAKYGGDCISLVAHIKTLGMKQAAEWIAERIEAQEPAEEVQQQAEQPGESVEDPAKTDVWNGLGYLEYENDLVQELGFDADDCEKLGIGYAKKGMMRGRVAIPIRLPSGHLVGYVGILENVKIPKTWQM